MGVLFSLVISTNHKNHRSHALCTLQWMECKMGRMDFQILKQNQYNQVERIIRSHTVQPADSIYLSPSPTQGVMVKPQRNQINKMFVSLGISLKKIIELLQIVNNEKEQQQLKEENLEKEEEEEKKTEWIHGSQQKQIDKMSKDCQNDNMSDKSQKNIIQQGGFIDTVSMKSMKSRKSEKNLFDDTSSVKSLKSDISKINGFGALHYFDPTYQNILQEEDSTNQQCQELENGKIPQKIVQEQNRTKKLRFSQLAPLMDRLGRLLVDMAPHIALMGSKCQQQEQMQNLNISMMTNQGSLQSQMIRKMNISNSQQENELSHYQIPVMLKPFQFNMISNIVKQKYS